MQLTPFRDFPKLDSLFDEYLRLFNRRLPARFDANEAGNGWWAPTADISETKKEYLIQADLPDVKKSDIHISVSDGTITIDGERKRREEEKDETFHRIESMRGKFTRSFAIPSNVDENAIIAECKNGVLRVRLPKTKESEPKEPKEIEVH